MKSMEFTLRYFMDRQLPASRSAEESFREASRGMHMKWVVLDDDPTGTQTVDHVSVFTDWSEKSIEEGFLEARDIFFILTNSRSMTEEKTAKVHRTIAERILRVSEKYGMDFQIICRGDSTLRGHYPLETETIKNTIEALSDIRYDGEIICPFFPQGGRYTIDNIHYVMLEDQLCPAGETEFARDKTFGYASSDLGAWVEEKTKGRYPASEQLYIGIEELRSENTEEIADKITSARSFQKIIVNALTYEDIYVFGTALLKCIKKGRHFLYRTAATFPEVMGGIRQHSLLKREQVVEKDNPNGGLIIVGSHVKKTTEQLEKLLELETVVPIPFRSSLVLDPIAFQKEIEETKKKLHCLLSAGKNVVIFTERKVLLPDTENPEDALQLSMKISDAVTSLVETLSVRPSFLIAKGGITSSEIGVKGLHVRKAEVIGQISQGVPVWRTGRESKFPGMPYIIFPGNVGAADDLKRIVEQLTVPEKVLVYC